jgi:hypothetical protein
VVRDHLGAKDLARIFPGYAYKQRLGLLRS